MSNININLVDEAKAFVEKHGIKQGWTQKQHIGLMASTIRDALGLERSEDIQELVSILSQGVNPSAFRQKLEDKGILAKVAKENKGIDISEYL